MDRQTLGALLMAGALGAGPCLAADTAPDSPGAYIGVFGGTGTAIASSLRQRGAVLLPGPLPPLPIDAQGSTGSGERVSLGGIQAGYEWGRRSIGSTRWGLNPATEIEAFHLGEHTPVGEMPVTPRALGTQYVTFPMTADVLLANAVFTIHTPFSDTILPYVGAGAGLARLSVKGSDSANPSEPGINHFNSDPDASDTAFAMQFKVGLKAKASRRVRLFAEYRHLSIEATRYTFGSTDYPGLHLPTRTWDVGLGRQNYNLFVAGLQYRF